MSDRIFLCRCRKCGVSVEFKGTYAGFSEYLNTVPFACTGGHKESRSPRVFLEVIKMSEAGPTLDWKPSAGRKYVNILDYQTVRIGGMQIVHIGSGMYVDRRTGKKYDYEEDMKGERHYFEVSA
jgi:hypothetical protein